MSTARTLLSFALCLLVAGASADAAQSGPRGGSRQRPPRQAPPEEAAPPAAPEEPAVPVRILRNRKETVVDPTEIMVESFTQGDVDGDGLLTWPEAERVFGFDRPNFIACDDDRDGLVDQREFIVRWTSLQRAGQRPPRAPKTLPPPPAPPRRDAPRMRLAYDADLDGRLALTEVGRVLEDYGRNDLDAAAVIRRIDVDATSDLDIVEIESFVQLVYGPRERNFGAEVRSLTEPGAAPPDARTLEREFARRRTQRTRAGSVQPPRFDGPTGTFRRLDADGNGNISTTDIEELMRPLQISLVRIPALVAALDENGDGVLSLEEFERSMR